MKTKLLFIPIAFYAAISINSSANAQTTNEKNLYEQSVSNLINDAARNEVLSNSNNSSSKYIPAYSETAPPPTDTDNDGMPDTWESANSLNLNDPKDAYGDPDGDQVINLFEYQLASNPQSAATPTTVNVPTSGNIATAIGAATAGQVLRVEAGTYLVNYQTFTPKTIMIQGGWNSTFTSRDPWTSPTIFDGQNAGEVLYFGFNIGTSNVVVDGLTLTNGNGSFGAFNFWINGTAISNLGMKDCKVMNSESSFNFGGAVNIHHRNTSSSEVFLIGNVIVNNGSSGIYNQNPDDAIAEWHVINNTISNNSSVDAGEGYGIYGFTLDNATLDIDIKNTISWGNQKDDLNYAGNGGPVTISSAHSDIDVVTAGVGVTYTPGAVVINSNPLFVSPTADFHLTSGSPCINQGIDVGLPFFNSAPEMGAYELNSTGMNEMNESSSFNVYPNPTSGNATIQFNQVINNGTLNIYNVFGQQVKQINNISGQSITVSSDELAPGQYFLHFSDGSKTIVKEKLIFVD